MKHAILTRHRPALAAFYFAMAVVSVGCQGSVTPPPAPTAEDAPPTPVHVTSASVQEWPSTVRVQGSLMADEQAVVGSRVNGLVRSVMVDLGSVVKKGERITELQKDEFTLKVTHAEAQLRQAKARLGLKPDDPLSKLDRLLAPTVRQEQAMLDEARAKAERARRLLSQKAISVEEVQLLDTALGVADARYQSSLNGVDEQIALLGVYQAEVDIARQELEDTEIVAPFDGVVQDRHAAPGVYLQAGAPVITLVRINPLRFRAGVPERYALQVRPGQTVHLIVEGEPQPIQAQISRVAPALDMASRSLIVEADVPNPGGKLRTGLFAEADIVLDPHARALAVPLASVKEFAGIEKVWVIREGKAKEAQVRTGRRNGGRVEILDGLNAGDVVASDAREGKTGPVVVVTPANRDGAAAE